MLYIKNFFRKKILAEKILPEERILEDKKKFWQLAGGSWQLAVGRWQLAGGRWLFSSGSQ